MNRDRGAPERTPRAGGAAVGFGNAVRSSALDPWLVSEVPHGLPLGMPEFVGRSIELAQISARLETLRVVTLTGPSGIGKTRLAVEVALRLLDSFPDGAWFVDLAPVTEPDLVPQATASALGFDPEPGRDPTETLTTHLQHRNALLILDNCEHLVGACAELAQRLVSNCDGVSILATSQHPLAIAGERTHAVGALSLPEPRPTPSIGSALESEAIRLFCTRASASHRGFRLTDEVLPAIAEICHRLDGIPLAIELAAAHIAVLGPAEIAERVEERFRLLCNGSPDTAARHRTLRAALDWSYDLLSDEEATLFRRLSVFTGGAGLTAVEEVCSGKGAPRDDIVELLASLVGKSLVVADTSRARARYHLLDTVRAYGRARLEEAGEMHEVSSRHAAWCTGLVERSWHQIAVGDPHVSVGMLELEHDNLRAAMDWAAEADPRAGLRLASALTPFWKTRGYLREGRQRLSRMLEAAASASGNPAAGPPQPALRARAQWGIGMLAALQGDVDAARPALEDSLALAREAKLARAEAQALNLLGFVSIFTQDPLAARPLLAESVAMARAAGDISSVTSALALLGRAHILLGDLGEARTVYEECLKLTDHHSYRALFGLAWTALASGEEARARQLFEQVVPLLRDAGERFEMALGLSFLGELAWARGDVAHARILMDDGLELARATGAPFPLVRCLAGLAHVAQAGGEPDAAATFADEACEMASSARLPFALVRCLHVRGATRSAAGDTDGAKNDYDEALSVARANRDRAGVALSLQRLAAVARARGADDEATTQLYEALTLQVEVGNAGVPSSIEAIAGMGAGQGRPAHAARLFGAAEALRQAHGAARRPDEVAGYETDVAHLRSVLDAAEFAEAWVDGGGLPRDEAVALALRGRGARDRDRPVHGWASLTPTEREIVDLVAGGMTNREVGEHMFISPRTVQGHLTRVFSKLNVTSRRELRDTRRQLSSTQ